MLLSIGIAFCFDDLKRWFVAISPRLLFQNRMYNFAEPNLLCKYVNTPKSPCPLLDRGCSRPFKNSIILSADLVNCRWECVSPTGHKLLASVVPARATNFCTLETCADYIATQRMPAVVGRKKQLEWQPSEKGRHGRMIYWFQGASWSVKNRYSCRWMEKLSPDGLVVATEAYK